MSEAGVVEQTAAVEAPPATAEPTPKPNKLESMTKAERLEWRLKVGRPSDAPAPTPTPTEPPANESTESADAESDSDQAPQPEPTTGKPRHDMKARLSQLAEQRRMAEARAERAEKMAAELAAKLSPQEPAPKEAAAPVETGEPKLEDFLDAPDPIAAHAKAMALWAVNQFKQELAQAQTEQQLTQTVESIRKAGAAKYADWKERQTSDAARIEMPPHVVEAILVDLPPELSADVLYHLSDHPDEARALAAMEPRAAVLKIGTLSATLAQPKVEPTPRTPPKTVSDAPAPGVTLGGRAAAPADELEAARKSKDFRRFREEFNRRELAKKK